MKARRLLPCLFSLGALVLPRERSEAQCLNGTMYPDFAITAGGSGVPIQIDDCMEQFEYAEITGIQAGATYKFTGSLGSFITVRQDTYDGAVLASGYSPVLAVAATNGDLFAHYNVNHECDEGFDCETAVVQAFLDCQPPIATATVVDDCPSNSFTVSLNVTSTGDGGTVTLEYSVNSGAPTSIPGVGVGEFSLGPFTIGDVVDLTVAHESNPECNQVFNGLVSNGNCPYIVDCGGVGQLDFSFCYSNNDSHQWTFQSSGGQAMQLSFSAGSIESANYDHLRIYLGTDNTGTLLYDHTMFQQEFLSGLSVVGGPSLFMEMSSDGSVSCGDGGQSSWQWTVQCLDCFPPVVDFSVQTDCASDQFYVNVDITSMGSDPALDIGNDGGAAVVSVPSPGTYQVGPFPLNTPVVVTVVNDENDLCSVASNPLVNTVCPIISCGPDNYTYCYQNNDHTYWVYQSSSGQPIGLEFTSGTIYPFDGDELLVYDGLDTNAPVIFEGNNNGNSFAGMQWISTNPDNALTLQVNSTQFTSCADFSTDEEWNYFVACYDGCSPPAATWSTTTDCASSTFTIETTITDMGTAPSINITNDGGAPDVLATTPGTYSSGPFTFGAQVTVTAHSTSALCDVHSDVLTNTVCPIISCGPDEYTYCYQNDDHTYWVYQSSNGQPIGLQFLAGDIYPFDGDELLVYDGLDTNAPLLYEGSNGGASFDGFQWISSNPDNALTLQINSTQFTSCSDGATNEPWHYLVACYDGCTAPVATYSPVTDCSGSAFSIETTITDMGTAPSLSIENDGGAAPVPASGPGTYTSGPFPLGTPVTITVQSTSALCNVHSDALLNPLCPDTIHCGDPALEETYCYTNNDSHTWHYVSSGSQPLAILFSSGSIESVNYDHLTIYDGPNNQAPILYQHTIFQQEFLDNLLVISTGTHLYMEMSSDGSVSCGDGGQNTWNWTVGCLDCTNPVADFQVVPDCIHNSFNVAVNVTSLGTAGSLHLANSLDTLTMDNVGLGTTLFGPFALDSTTTVGVYNSANSLCRIFSQPMTYATADCVIPSCAATTYEYCYINSDTAWFMYNSSEAEPLTINFLWGQLNVNDYIQIFNGIGTTATTGAPIIYMGNNGGDMTGFAINSIDGANALTMRVISNASNSCSTGQGLPLHWAVACGEVGVSELAAGDFAMFPNPTTGELYIRLPEGTNGKMDLRVIDVAGRQVRHEAFTAQAGVTSRFDLQGLQDGNYTVILTSPDHVKAQQLQVIH